MIKNTVFYLLLCFSLIAKAQLTPPSNLSSYYADVNFNNSGTALFNELATTTIAKHTNILQYSERHNYLYDADKDLVNNSNVILLYTSESRDKREYQSGNNSYSPQTFNTEHVYPRSLINNTAEADLHHLRTCDISVNSSRSNLPFVDGSGTYKIINNSWFPGDEWKGDVARMILYLNLRYNESFDDVGSLNLFLKWNAEDPVSDFELARHEVIASAQGNRNPLIDNPYIATVIWGNPPSGTNQPENRWATLSNENYTVLETVSIYPNPSFSHTISIKIPEEVRLKSLVLYSIIGSKVFEMSTISTNQNLIKIENLKSGLYLLKLKDENRSVTKKIIIK